MIYGRDAERTHLADVVEAARVGMSTALVVSGEAGAGKSTLLEDLARHAIGLRTLRALGAEAESERPFAGLHELLAPLLGELDALAAPRRRALATALELGPVDSAPAPGRFLIAAAVLDLLANAAERVPLLAIVDDAQWIDGASQDALLFVARRLAGEGIALIFGARDGDARRFDAAGVVRLELVGLDEAATIELIEHWSEATPSAAVAAHLVAATGGNPLALTELAATLDPAVLAGWAPLPDPLPVAAGIEAAFSDRVLRLGERTRSLLLLAALEPAADLALLEHAGEAMGADSADLEAAELAGLVRIESGRVVFDHPLVRSAVEGAAGEADLRRAHLALAAALPAADMGRRVWHAAAAAIEPDEQLAVDLEKLGARARERAGNAAAQAALTRAAELSPQADARGRRLVAAAEAAWQAGRAAKALELIERAGALAEPRVNARAARLRGDITLRTGSLADGHRLLMEAARDTASVDPRTAYMLVGEASRAGCFAGNPVWLAEAGALAGSFPDPGDDASRSIRRAVIGIGKLASGDAAGAIAEIREVLEAAQGDDPELLEYGIAVAWLMGDEALSARLLSRAERMARERTMIAALPLFLVLRSMADYDAGRLASAASAADEGARLARESGRTTILAANLAHAARAAAVRGDATRYASAASEAAVLAGEHGLRQVESVAAHATALHEIGMGRYEAARAPLARVTHPALAPGRASDACEIAIHLDRPADAVAALAELEQLAAAMPLAWVDGLLERARGVTTNAVGDRHFQRAIALHGNRRPFERARTELAYGETLRRTRRRIDARAPLHRALETFERIGAEPWAARADRELRATGEPARRRDPPAIDQLTPQELTICQLAAQGLTNRDIGARLFLSPRTVDYHLRKVLPKLGIGSRAELVRFDLDGSGTPSP